MTKASASFVRPVENSTINPCVLFQIVTENAIHDILKHAEMEKDVDSS